MVTSLYNMVQRKEEDMTVVQEISVLQPLEMKRQGESVVWDPPLVEDRILMLT